MSMSVRNTTLRRTTGASKGKDLCYIGAGGLHGVETPVEGVLLLPDVDGAVKIHRLPVTHHKAGPCLRPVHVEPK